MPRILAPFLQSVTYARWLHLLIGTVFAGVVLVVYPGIEGGSPVHTLTAAAVVDTVLLCLAALIPATRRAEGVQARLLLVPAREESIGAAPSASWADRWRTACWLVARVGLGTAVGLVSVRGAMLAVDLAREPLAGARPLLAPVVLLVIGWSVVLVGRLQLRLAQGLLGPSRAERLAAAELRAERLLERNRLARELHDSIGHALTVTVLQAGAAREVADPAFRDRALEVIESTGRQAMEDLERTLVLLRESPDGAAVERPGLDQVPALLATARAAGSPVEDTIEARAEHLPGVLSREAYRIVQESVTNALKYAPGVPIRVVARIAGGALELHCANGVPGEPRRRPGGKGLRGIRERAVLLGGEASTGMDGSDWVVRVRLPLRLAA
ncbi:histidine kinase [Kitasatospora sp. NBC_00374]|uniref:sensor histidine kinase n=1 Tax=Kitasatospora sp. NBC_00374 TaxID=2975964 RepID=UPI0030E0488E